LQILAVCAVTLMLRYAAPVLLPFVISILVFYALGPIVDRLERWRCPRLIGSSVVVALLAGAVVGAGYALWPQVSEVLEDIPASAAKLRATFQQQKRQGDGLLRRVQEAASAIDSAAAEVGNGSVKPSEAMPVEVRQPFRVSDFLWTGGMSMLSLAGQSVIILFLTIVLLNEHDSFKRKLVTQMETLGSKRVTVKVLNDIATQVHRFIWVQAATSAFVSVVTAGALYLLEVKQPIVWGLFAGVMNIIPYFGPMVVSFSLLAIAYVQFGTVGQALTVAAVALGITTFEGLILTPHLVSRAGALNHVAVFLSIAFWSWAWGVPGMLLAVPMLMSLKAVCDHVEGLEAIGRFLGD
jgi:predicted PurR-regulated permease PerM